MALAEAIAINLLEAAIAKCHNSGCTSNGKRVMVWHKIQCACGFDLKFRRDTTSVCEGAPKVFR